MKRYKAGQERKIINKSAKLLKRLRWDMAVVTLTGALTQAIWQEGGTLEDAKATADIVHHAMCSNLDDMFLLSKRHRKIVPFNRNRSYFKGKAGGSGTV